MNESKTFIYEGSPVTFQIGEATMVNATEMAKSFGKQPVDWLKTNQAKSFLDAFSKLKNISFADLLIVRKGSSNLGGGTWMHEDVALEFARWLSPQFAIWCNDRIKELMK